MTHGPLVLENPVYLPSAPNDLGKRRAGGPFWALIMVLTIDRKSVV